MAENEGAHIVTPLPPLPPFKKVKVAEAAHQLKTESQIVNLTVSYLWWSTVCSSVYTLSNILAYHNPPRDLSVRRHLFEQ
jgi:hypothetical protein